MHFCFHLFVNSSIFTSHFLLLCSLVILFLIVRNYFFILFFYCSVIDHVHDQFEINDNIGATKSPFVIDGNQNSLTTKSMAFMISCSPFQCSQKTPPFNEYQHLSLLVFNDCESPPLIAMKKREFAYSPPGKKVLWKTVINKDPRLFMCT